jgi:allantoate deiminase
MHPQCVTLPMGLGRLVGKKGLRMASLAINIDRLWNDIETLASFSAGGAGVNRLTFSQEDQAARTYLRQQMATAGLKVVEFPPGVMLGRLSPPTSTGPCVMSGSHIDAVPAARRFDGIVGVVGALEVGRVLAEQRVALKHPYEVVIYPDEEGTRFGAVLTGSKAWGGELNPQQLANMKDRHGTSYLTAMEAYGLKAADLDGQRFEPERTKAVLELHIEQSVVREACGMHIGVVTTITGMIFIPSCGGRSHCPEEYSGPAQIEHGINVLLDAVLALAG